MNRQYKFCVSPKNNNTPFFKCKTCKICKKCTNGFYYIFLIYLKYVFTNISFPIKHWICMDGLRLILIFHQRNIFKITSLELLNYLQKRMVDTKLIDKLKIANGEKLYINDYLILSSISLFFFKLFTRHSLPTIYFTSQCKSLQLQQWVIKRVFVAFLSIIRSTKHVRFDTLKFVLKMVSY